MLVYNVTSKVSFQEIQLYYNEIQESSKGSVARILVGTASKNRDLYIIWFFENFFFFSS